MNAMTADAPQLWAEYQVTTLAEGAREWTVPSYGSPAWNQLPPSDPRRYAAVIEAAEQWRRQTAEEQRLDQLAEDDPAAWYAEVTAGANEEARRLAGRLARMRTLAELDAARTHRPPRQLHATPGWPPVAIPGKPGRYLHPAPSAMAA
ncbi:uncharacterized protein DUF2742 [Streptomyces sp. KhCrAH-43]|uniref:DUF2742 domain-containing protein n=1 Tax=unclassified Streptomyces TaxID=2593676 RepID=UPI0003744E01|nr:MULTISPECIES: DUF2742 domain-containing protein [unclassified Streptomyces]MYS36351.1 DUF2742 domain-containing protein [Streptomyces sp. SID4920]MYX64006.1 DUF2742 domain-containing protein [Streptomyces sp. SID8373]RAJ44300.1 uncharacterized protein DUF2742 [Streptomyces sp. KhCrAH-43]